MVYYLPSDKAPDGDEAAVMPAEGSMTGQMADLRVFWGPEICRLEYLLHLLDTGRIIDETARPA